MKKDILVFISDQHAWQQGFGGDTLVRTPNLDRIAAEGTLMQNNYTAYPLCVPARMSMMSGQLASNCNVMHNFASLSSDRATFAHRLNAVGYETVLCGRMHFVGPDQRHGFSRRIAGEMTPIYHNRPGKAFQEERGVHLNTPTGGPACLTVIGGGNSPTLEYDRYVVREALHYLEESHEAPQLLVVGTYAPHHPYVAPKELYEYYYDRVTVPEETFSLKEHPAIEGTILCDKDPEVVRAVRAAYYGMVEFEDQLIGQVYDAFQAYLTRSGREGVFVYVSDHGDHIGYRGYYGKNTFYEASAHVPMVFAGAGVEKGRKLYGATSLTDLGPTLCDIAGADIFNQLNNAPSMDGVSLYPQLCDGEDDLERMVISELGGGNGKSFDFFYGQMVKKGSLKFIHYEGFDSEDVMYDVEADPLEKVNVIDSHRELAEEMRRELKRKCQPVERIRENARTLLENLPILGRCEFDSEERWRCPPCARDYPEHMVCSQMAAEKVRAGRALPK